MKKRLGIDIDIVVAATDKMWDKWLQHKCFLEESKIPKEDIEAKKVHYNISLYYKEELRKYNIDPMQFWRDEDLYNNCELVPGAIQALNKLQKHYDLVFISTVKGNHHKSKYYFIKNIFPNMLGFIATKEKHLVNIDVMIDDRIGNLINLEDNVTPILFDSPYEQGQYDEIELIMNWDRILEYLEVK